MPLYTLEEPLPDLEAPVVIAAFDGWVDAGSAATTVLELLGDGAQVVARFDPDQLFDYRSRRPTLTIRNGRLDSLEWPEVTLRAARHGGRDLLVLTGAEPDDRWHHLADDTVELLGRLGVAGWISLGAIPAAVAHTRAVPILGTASRDGLLRGGVLPGPAGLLRVPSAALSMLEIAVSESGVPAVGYFAQIPHYVSGPYALAALELLRSLERHLDVTLPHGDLEEESRQLRERLDAATAADETTRAYVERLESMVDEARQPSGDDLIAEIERFLRGRADGGGS
jgi:PAC2 family protein